MKEWTLKCCFKIEPVHCDKHPFWAGHFLHLSLYGPVEEQYIYNMSNRNVFFLFYMSGLISHTVVSTSQQVLG